ncbi:Calcium-binding protein 39 [Glycine soja]
MLENRAARRWIKRSGEPEAPMRMAARVRRSRRSHRVQTRELASRLDLESRRRKISMSNSSGSSVLIQSWPRIESSRFKIPMIQILPKRTFRTRFQQAPEEQIQLRTIRSLSREKGSSIIMSFSFFKALRPKTPQEVAKSIKESLMALDTKTVVEVKALEKIQHSFNLYRVGPFPIDPKNHFIQFSHWNSKRYIDKRWAVLWIALSMTIWKHRNSVALEEVEKNFVTMRTMLSGDGESEPNLDQVSQLVEEICKEDVLTLLIHKLPILGWEARKDLVHCWSILLKHKVETNYYCVEYIEQHIDYDNKDIALSCGIMLRECIKFPSLARYILESASFVLFFKFVELPNFDVASDAFSTFKDLLTKHVNVVSEFLTAHYDEFFDLYEKLLTSPNYVTRRQSLKLLSEFLLESPNSQIMKQYILEVRYLKVMMTLLRDSSKNIQLSAFHIFKVFVANPNKPREVQKMNNLRRKRSLSSRKLKDYRSKLIFFLLQLCVIL